MLEVTGNCWYVRKQLMYFFYHVYLDTEREFTEELLNIKKSLIMKLQVDLDEIPNTLLNSRVQLMTHRGIQTIRAIKEEYYFGALLLCVETIIKKRMIDDYTTREEFHQVLITSLVSMSNVVESKRNR
jgi:hypothetical protein